MGPMFDIEFLSPNGLWPKPKPDTYKPWTIHCTYRPFFSKFFIFLQRKNSSQTVRESSAFSGILDRFKNRGTEALKPWCFKFHTIISLWKTPVLKASLHDFRSFGPHCLILAFVISQFCVSSYLFWPPSPPRNCVFYRGEASIIDFGGACEL